MPKLMFSFIDLVQEHGFCGGDDINSTKLYNKLRKQAHIEPKIKLQILETNEITKAV